MERRRREWTGLAGKDWIGKERNGKDWQESKAEQRSEEDCIEQERIGRNGKFRPDVERIGRSGAGRWHRIGQERRGFNSFRSNT